MYFQSQKLSWLVRITGLFGLLSTLTIEAAMQPQAVVAPQKPAALLLKLPLSFEENVGQMNGAAKFIARAPGFTLFATPGEMVTVMNSISPAKERAVIRTQLKGADRSAQLRGEGEQSAKSNYLIGNDPKKWVSGAAHYSRVRQAGVYPGIDLVYHGDNSRLEYDFVVAPGADPKRIRLNFAGAEKIVIDDKGDLKLVTAHGELMQRKPLVYQITDGQKQVIAGEYTRIGKRDVGLKIGPFDRNKELVIDPVVEYATYFGGLGTDRGQAIATDAQGNVYIAGTTNSTDFPVTTSSIKGSNVTNADLIFLSKINTSTNALIFSTYLGGVSNANYAYALAVDNTGAAYIAGESFATDFPVINGIQITNAGGSDIILAKLTPAGNALAFSTYLGGNTSESALGIAVDNDGNTYLTGQTGSDDFPLKNAIQSTAGSLFDAFVVKINTTSKTLVYSTFLGGDFHDKGLGVIADATGHAFVVGETLSSNFPTTSGAFRTTYNGGQNGFVVKLGSTGQTLDYATFLGDSFQHNSATAVKLNSDGNVVVVGKSIGGGCFADSTFIGAHTFDSGYLLALNSNGTALTLNTCIGGGPLEDLAIGADGTYYVSGVGNNTLTVNDTVSIQPFHRFILKLASDGTRINSATSVNLGDDFFVHSPHRISIDSTSHVYMTGTARIGNTLSVTTANLGGALRGPEDAFLIKVGPTLPSSVNLVGTSTSLVVGQSAQFTATIPGASSGIVTFRRDSVVLGSQPLVGSVATLVVTDLPIGASKISAFYDGGDRFDSSESTPVTVIVSKAKPTATLNMSSTDPDPGDHVTATVTVKGGSNPTGSVIFRVDGEVKATSFLASTGPDSGTASAEFVPEGNGPASSNFEATYNGDDNNEAATTNSIRVTTNSGIFGGIGGGGCTLGAGSRDVTLPILLLLALWGSWRNKRQRT